MIDLSYTRELIKYLKPEELAELEAMAKAAIWLPLPGPQMEAYYCEADELFYGGCVSGDTEFLTPHGWKRIDSFCGDRVAQWDNGVLNFVYPEKYMVHECDELNHFYHNRLSMVLSDDHRMPLYDYNGKLVVKSAKEVREKPSRHIVPTNFTVVGSGIDISESMLRLTVAVHADGEVILRKRKGGALNRICLRKDRKKDRLKSLLNNIGIEWREYHNPKRPTEVRYAFFSDIVTKKYDRFWCASQNQLEIILDEMSYWDGYISGKNGGDICFTTKNKRDADFMQYAAHACNRVASIGVDKKDGQNDVYKVHISHIDSHKSSVTLRVDAISIDRIKADRMYCFEVQSSFWLARHNGRIFVTGNSAGGGKSDLLLGLALTAHRRSIIFRREAPQLQGILDRLHQEILKSKAGYNGQDKIQRLSKGRQIEFGSCPHLGDESRFQGRPHDLICFDELAHFLPQQYTFLTGWLRTTYPGQRCRIVSAGNPPTDSDGEWVTRHWGPWLDPDHPNPAKPGELLWFAMVDGKETRVPNGDPFDHDGEIITPRSRTFISSSVEDNPFLMATGYRSMLQSLPEPLRSQMLNGDFKAGMDDDVWQVIPTEWVRQAQSRWEPGRDSDRMDSVGVDVARGGNDETVIARRHGNWFDNLICYPGSATPNGSAVASLVFTAMRDGAPIHVDVIGVGASVYDHCHSNGITVKAINGAEKPISEFDSTGTLRFVNRRAELYWKLREALDPQNKQWICLPKDPQLKADLCAPRWKLTPRGVQVESKEDIIKRIGRSPDRGDAVVYGLEQTIPAHIYQSHSEPDFIEVF